jgi:hypothetical protein
MEDTLPVRVEIGLAGLERGHPATQLAAEEFWYDVGAEPTLTVEDTGGPLTGTKGVEQVLTVVLTSPVAMYSLVKIVKLWLGRDRDRSVSVSFDSPEGAASTVTVDGEKISIDLLEKALHEALGAMESNKTK